MKQFYTVVLTVLIISIQATGLSVAQTFNGNITLTTQAEVDSFGALGYSHITGDLLIGDTLNMQATNIADISSLMSLQSIGSSLFIINNNPLQTLQGIDSISHIGFALDIFKNSNLNSLTNTGDIDSISYLRIRLCPNITNFNGLESITHISGDLAIIQNLSLTSFSGLHNLLFIEDEFAVNFNPSIYSCLGLEALAFVGGYFQIYANNNLNTLSGLESLISVGQVLIIGNNNNLETLSGLDNLTSIEGWFKYLNILNNANLIDYCALNNFVNNGNFNVITTQNYVVNNNEYNPTQGQLEVGECNSILNIENNALTTISLTPNPTTGTLNIDFGLLGNNSVRVLNQLGQVVYKMENISESVYHFNIEAPKGIYTVEVFSEESRKQFKVIKL